MNQKTFCLVIFVLFITFCYGQSDNKQQRPILYGGIGAGLDYGGFGFKVEFLPVKNIGVFAGAGLNIDELGYNGGLSLKLISRKISTPTLLAMYGYNAVLIVKSPFGGTAFSETYYGFSAGAGYNFNVGKNDNIISLAVLVPFRSKEFDKKYREYKDAGYTFNPDISTFVFSIGFNIAGYSNTGKK